jgi:hypothetical protein
MSTWVRREVEHGANTVSLHGFPPFDVFCFPPAADFPVVDKQRVQETLRIE